MTTNQPATSFTIEFPYSFQNPQQEALMRYQTMYDPPQITLQKAMSQVRPTILDYLKSDPRFQIMARLVAKAGMESYYGDPTRKITLFATPDEVFGKAPAHVIEALDRIDAGSLLRFATIEFPVLFNDMRLHRRFYANLYRREPLYIDGFAPISVFVGPRLLSNSLTPTVFYSPAVVGADNVCQNGVIHIIDSPLIPNGAR